MILGLNLTFNIKGKKELAKELKIKNKVTKINGTRKWERIKLQEKDLEDFDFCRIKKDAYFSHEDKLLYDGMYKIRYNEKDYYMDFLDEFELFKQVVVREE